LGRSRQPPRERQHPLAQLGGPLDDEGQVERRQQRGQPAELLRPDLGPQPARRSGSARGIGRHLGQRRHAGREPGPDLLDGAPQAQDHVVPVGGGGQAVQQPPGRFEPGGRLERAGQRPGVSDPVEPEGPVSSFVTGAGRGIGPGDVPPASVRDQAVRVQHPVGGAAATWYTRDFAEISTPLATLAIGSERTVGPFGAGVARPAANGTVIIEFLLDDVDAVFNERADVLGEVVQRPATMPWGNRSLLFRDPDGNLVNFFTPVTPAAVAKFTRS
jgi:predicted enzyme related to lactoylglutathione lyase